MCHYWLQRVQVQIVNTTGTGTSTVQVGYLLCRPMFTSKTSMFRSNVNDLISEWIDFNVDVLVAKYISNLYYKILPSTKCFEHTMVLSQSSYVNKCCRQIVAFHNRRRSWQSFVYISSPWLNLILGKQKQTKRLSIDFFISPRAVATS